MNMQVRPIEDLASFVRDLGSECTTLNVDYNYLLAGSKMEKLHFGTLILDKRNGL